MSKTSSSPSPAMAQPTPPRAVVVRVLATQLLLAALIGFAFILLYAGLQRNPQPRHLPISVAGQSNAATLQRALGDAVNVTEVWDSAAAQGAVRDRSAVAAFEVTATELHIFIAGPNGLAENGAAMALGQDFARSAGLRVKPTDLVPLLPFDPRALASFYTVLGITVGSFILGQALYALRLLAGFGIQLVAAVIFAGFISTITAVLVGPVLRLLPMSVLALTPLLTLLSLAVSLTTRALTAWFDAYGIFAATLLMTAVGLSTSGGIIGPDLLPPPLGFLGAMLPPGAALRAVVDIAYFSVRQAVIPLLILLGWLLAAAGSLLLHRIRRRITARATPTVDSASVA